MFMSSESSLNYLHALRSNHTLSRAERHDLEAKLARWVKVIDGLDEEPGLSVDNSFVEKIKIASEEAHQIRGILSPIRLLPPELLSAVFLQCNRTYPNPDPREAPLLLTHVCCHWRRVAVSTPMLWSALHVHPHKDQDKLHSYKSLLELFLTRSDTTPLYLRLQLLPVAPEGVLDIIVPHAHRWRDIQMDMQGHPKQLQVLIGVAETPLLRTITIQTPDRYRFQQHHLQDIKCFRRAPLLRHLALMSWWDPSLIQFPWSQLTHLRLGGDASPATFTASSWSDMLRQCVELRHLELDFADARISTSPVETPILLPHLQFLKLQNSVGDSALFHRLVAPKLTDLSYCPPFGRVGFVSVGVFKSFIGRSHCTVTSLSLRLRDEFAKAVIGWLECVSAVINLRVDFQDAGRGAEPALLEALSYQHTSFPDDTRYLLPKLQRVHLIPCSPTSRTQLVDMIRARRFVPQGSNVPLHGDKIPQSLLSAHIEPGLIVEPGGELGYTKEMLSLLQDVIEDGMEIRVSYEHDKE
ncbi:hypothetical protein JAAARDRAFT_495695 [Jaapia argillacea MUCL 33604]|uniref:Uncharacterized protein n=1 Tax=Jaapia argillacea MUCL 33604 TaxID=933084 RepID=A0A067PNI9_9AGAM|nr:hypothetical protein JAAARDRAFT_495695 [Jaapia argillacea MUCL 33604]